MFKNLLLLSNLTKKLTFFVSSSKAVGSMWGERKTELRWEFTWRALSLRWALSGCSSLRVLSDSSSRDTDGEKAVLLLRSINREPEAFNCLYCFLTDFVLRAPNSRVHRNVDTRRTGKSFVVWRSFERRTSLIWWQNLNSARLNLGSGSFPNGKRLCFSGSDIYVRTWILSSELPGWSCQ